VKVNNLCIKQHKEQLQNSKNCKYKGQKLRTKQCLSWKDTQTKSSSTSAHSVCAHLKYFTQVEGSSTGSVEYKIPTYASEEGRGTQLYYMTEILVCTAPTLK